MTVALFSHAPQTGLRPIRSSPFPGLYHWQREALQAWEASGNRGVVEAVTGAGKTRVGVAAAHAALQLDMKVLIIVPTAELQAQWIATLERELPAARLGALGDGHKDSLNRVDVLVSIVHSAAASITLPANAAGLIIADECHRYAAPTFALALSSDFTWRLGLSATYERSDGAHLTTLAPFFGDVVFRIWYDRALADGIISEFDIAFVSVDLAPDEHDRYEHLSDVMYKAGRYLEHWIGIPKEPFPRFLAAVSQLAESDSKSRDATAARRYMSAMSARQTLLAESRTKQFALAALRDSVHVATRTLVFTQTKKSATTAANIYTSLGLPSSTIISGMPRPERKGALRDFRDGNVRVLTAPKVLDEGIDVPEADLGIILAPNKSRRQLVQRLGRVVRKKQDGRTGRLVVLYSRGTVEDPRVQGDKYVIDLVEFARNVGFFEIENDAEKLTTFLRPSQASKQQADRQDDVPSEEPLRMFPVMTADSTLEDVDAGPSILDLFEETTEWEQLPWDAMVVNVTPELAEKWLRESKTVNRNLDKKHIGHLAQALKDGTYQTTPQGISFSLSGDLIDGHHRLHAIALARVAQQMVVFYGVDPGSFIVFDSIAKVRSLSDIVKTAGISATNSAQVAAGYKLLWNWNAGRQNTGAGAHLSAAQLVAMHEDHPQMTEMVVPAKKIAAGSGVNASALLVALFLTGTQRPDIDSGAFFGSLETGANLAADSPVLALRNYALKKRSSKAVLSQTDWLKAILKAWVYWADERPMAMLRITMDEKRPDLAAAGGGTVTVLKPGRGIQIIDLVEAGIIAADARLVSVDPLFRDIAFVRADGSINCGTRTFDTPSLAAAWVRGGSTNGWTFWAVAGDTGDTPLADLRTNYIQSKGIAA